MRPDDKLSASGGIVRNARRPEGWRAPGPRPPIHREADPGPLEDICYLLGDWRIYQRLDGHRWSLDDLITAAVATLGPAPNRICDLGCGIGSVLLMTAWSWPGARLVGVEAQPMSVELARRSVWLNGAEERVEIRQGDLRDPSIFFESERFDLVTGTPPYFDPSQGVMSELPQKGPCRFELRGGVEAYFTAASRLLTEEGRFVVCEDARQIGRVQAAASAVGLRVHSRLDVVPKEGKPPLFSVFTARRPRAHDEDAPARTEGGAAEEGRTRLDENRSPRTKSGAAEEGGPQLVVRNADGTRSDAFRRLRASMGLPH